METLISASGFKTLALAGNATLTIESRSTGRWYTYRIRFKEEKRVWYVYLLTGPDNTSSYDYIGKIDGSGRFLPGRMRGAGAGGFDWAWRSNTQNLGEKANIYHEGKCCRCGRKLTTPESVSLGIGPECAKRTGV